MKTEQRRKTKMDKTIEWIRLGDQEPEAGQNVLIKRDGKEFILGYRGKKFWFFQHYGPQTPVYPPSDDSFWVYLKELNLLLTTKLYVKANNKPPIRTQEEIIERIERVSRRTWMFEREQLIKSLNFTNAVKFLTGNKSKVGSWEKKDVAKVRQEIIDALPGAWQYAKENNNITTYNYFSHFSAFLWLIGDNELCDKLYYFKNDGKDELVLIGEYLGVGSRWDDGLRLISA